MYSSNPCLNAAVHNLQSEILTSMDPDTRNKAERAVQALVVPCALSQLLGDCKRMRLQCPCGKTWDSWNIEREGVEGPVVSLRTVSLISSEGMALSSLPDLGDYIRACFLKRYFTPKALATTARVSQWLEGNRRRKGQCTKYKAEDGGPCCAKARSWLVCSVLQDCLPCVQQHCRKNSRVRTTLTEPPTAIELNAVISLLYGTLLKLYPRGHKVPVFTARVALVKRIVMLQNSPFEQKLAFVESHPNLVRFCCMEYTCNVISDCMPSELHALEPHGNVQDFVRSCVTMFDFFRREFALKGDEPFSVADSYAKNAIERLRHPPLSDSSLKVKY